jgi:hypothetical protein
MSLFSLSLSLALVLFIICVNMTRTHQEVSLADSRKVEASKLVIVAAEIKNIYETVRRCDVKCVHK